MKIRDVDSLFEVNGSTILKANTLNEELKLENTWAGSLARIGHEPPKLGVAGSNPVPPATVIVF